MRIQGKHFKDEEGRILILRGVNLGGSSKIPAARHCSSRDKTCLYDLDSVSFKGKPFPLDEADEHFTRLRSWGFTVLRYVMPWEAVEHAGPGKYDEEYLSYTHALIGKASRYGISVIIDPHQDVWSRWTGGDGAPAWTLEKLGIDVTRIHAVGAATVHAEMPEPYKQTVWAANYIRYAPSTMFTLFFAGNDFAPGISVDGEPVQEFLQGRFCKAMAHVFKTVADLPNVIGFDTLNEPWPGFIGLTDLSRLERTLLYSGIMPSPFEGMLAASGIPVEVNVHNLWSRGRPRSRIVLNQQRISLFKPGHECVWKRVGVWDEKNGKGRLVRKDYFSGINGRPVDFNEDYLKPFIRRFAEAIRSVRKDAIVFMESVPSSTYHVYPDPDLPDIVHAFHWYDGMTLMTKRRIPFVCHDVVNNRIIAGSPAAVEKSFAMQLGALKEKSSSKSGPLPSFLGEFGLPFDLAGKRSYSTGRFTAQEKALSAYYNAIDANLLSSTIWNYTADNDNTDGDRWNDEDFSIFSRDQQKKTWQEDIDSGGRGVTAFCRPYAMRTSGEPLCMRFDWKKKRFFFQWMNDPGISAPTEVFIPRIQYPKGIRVLWNGGSWNYDEASHILRLDNPGHVCVCALTVLPMYRWNKTQTASERLR